VLLDCVHRPRYTHFSLPPNRLLAIWARQIIWCRVPKHIRQKKIKVSSHSSTLFYRNGARKLLGVEFPKISNRKKSVTWCRVPKNIQQKKVLRHSSTPFYRNGARKLLGVEFPKISNRKKKVLRHSSTSFYINLFLFLNILPSSRRVLSSKRLLIQGTMYSYPPRRFRQGKCIFTFL
jgi:hypothetical protein